MDCLEIGYSIPSTDRQFPNIDIAIVFFFFSEAIQAIFGLSFTTLCGSQLWPLTSVNALIIFSTKNGSVN